MLVNRMHFELRRKITNKQNLGKKILNKKKWKKCWKKNCGKKYCERIILIKIYNEINQLKLSPLLHHLECIWEIHIHPHRFLFQA